MHTPWLNDSEQAAWRSFLAMHTQVQHALRLQLQRDTELSASDYEILVCLSEALDGTLRSYQISAIVQWEPSRLSHQLRRMNDRGLVDRQDCPTDGRGVTVAITARGRDAITRAAPLHVAEVRRVFIDRLSPTQLDQLVSIAQSIVVSDECNVETTVS